MLMELQVQMEQQVVASIEKLDRAISALEQAISKTMAEYQNARDLCRFLGDDSGDSGPIPSFDWKIHALTDCVQSLLREKDQLLALLRQLEQLTKPDGEAFSGYRGTHAVHMRVDEALEQAFRLEATQQVISSDVERCNGLLREAFAGEDAPEAARVFDAVGEYAASAMKLQDACLETASELRKMWDQYTACEESVCATVEELPDVDLPNEAQCPRPMPAPPVAARKSCSEPVVAGGRNQTETKGRANTGKEKTGFFDLFRRKKKTEARAAEEAVVPPPAVDSVRFSAVAPNDVVPGKYLPVNILMYEEAFRGAVDEIVQSHGDNARESRSGYYDVERSASVRVVLSSGDVAVEDGEAVQKWNGKYLDFAFGVKIPKDFREEQILLTATVYINEIIATKLRLILDCKKNSQVRVTREDVLSAFVSYASQDRNRVAAIIQGMKKARPDMDIFFDIENLRSGQRWEEALKSEIVSRDILFLCWSKYARESKWVDMEWRYALESKGEEAIEPIPIDSPDVCPPPVELRQKHFNDKMLYIIKATMPEI